MVTMPNTRSVIITLYGDYIRHFGNEIWIGSLIELLEAFGYTEQSIRAAISRMSKQDWLTKRKIGNKSYYSLTEYGMKRTKEAAGRIYQIKPSDWDGLWRIFIYNIPERRRNIRDQMRKELIWCGFGSVSNSAWVTPNDLKNQVEMIINKYKITENVHFFTSQNIGPKSDQQIIKECWNIEEINQMYISFIESFLDKYAEDKDRTINGTLSDKECFVKRTMLVHQYRKSLFIDPGLPKELLPDRWMRDQAATLFQDYYQLLVHPANQYFEKIFQKGIGGTR